MHPRHLRRAAFTLIEMAIVIVIIGLLLGAVLAAKSYLRTANLAAMMTESKYYINALGQFQAQYKALPGDMANATNYWPSVTNGDGNGLIDYPSSPTELFGAFQQLAVAGFINGSYTGATNGGTNTATIGVNVPIGAVNAVTYLYDHPPAYDGNMSGNSYYYDGLYLHVLRVAGTTANGLPAAPFLTAEEAYNIDRKFDDGNPGTGWIETPKHTQLPSCTDVDTNAAVYQTTLTSTQSCYFILKIQ